jgi:hypothetical protein
MQLFDIVGVLRNAVPKTRTFNVFTAIGCESDEVFLHSKLIAALINSKFHRFGEQSLRSLLQHLGIPLEGEHGFLLRGVQVKTEFRGIDILVTNEAGQALVIENKIYAADQPQQLKRYYSSMRELGYTAIYIRYLTLDGRDPTPQSLDGLDQELASPWLGNASYASEISPWLDELAATAVREHTLRETIFQYQTVVDQLTGKEQEKNYMDELVNTLLIGDNMLLARDIGAAYRQGLIALQEKFWAELIDIFRQEHPRVSHSLRQTSVADPGSRRSLIRKYYEPAKKDRMYYGLCFTVPGLETAEVWLQIERALYVGVICEKGRTSREYRQIAQILNDARLNAESNNEWPMWRFIRADHDFNQPDEALLGTLCDPRQRLEYATACARAVAELWHTLVTARLPE